MDTTQLIEALRAAVANGQTYEEYSAMNKAMAKEGTTTGPQKPLMLNIPAERSTHAPLGENLQAFTKHPDNIASRTSEKEQWLVFSETWCGDAAHNLPFIAKWAEYAGVDLRIILRDENTELMDEFLTNGGRSIPKLVRLSENFEVLGTWGPRPTPLMEEYAMWKAQPEFDYKEWTLFAQDWYSKDKGASLEADFVDLLG